MTNHVTGELPTARDYQFALDSQSACNLSGIVLKFSETISRIWAEARAKNEGTEYVNKHPICRLYAEQITHLSGGGMTMNTETYNEAYKTCQERARV